jgi:hypothetical protein
MRGTKSAPIDALLFWRAELDAADFAYSYTSIDLKAAKSAEAAATDTLNAAKAALDTAKAAHEAVSRLVSNASARSARALERRQFAWDQYLTLQAANADERSPSRPSLPSALASPAGHGSVRMPSPGVEGDANDLNDDVFEGFLENQRGSGASDVDAMEVAQYL